SGKRLHDRPSHEDEVRYLAVSPDGCLLASGGSWEPSICLWDFKTGKRLHVLSGHKEWINCLAFSRDGRSLFSGGGDGTLRIWGVARGKNPRRFQSANTRQVVELASSADGKHLTALTWNDGPDGEVIMCEIATDKILARRPCDSWPHP